MLKIMIDTNILIAGGVLQSKYIQDLFGCISENHIIILPDYVISEFKNTVENKFPKRFDSAELFLKTFPFELVYVPEDFDAESFPDIRDSKDLPILVSAISEDVDVFITNDKDFKALSIKRPEILNPQEFLEKYNIK